MVVLLLEAGFAIAQLPSKQEILNKMLIANVYFMNKWPDPGSDIITDKTRASNIWTRAVYYEGLMALYKINPDTDYYDYAVRWAEAHEWGLNGGTQTRNANNHCCGQTYIALYLIDKNPERIKNIKASVDLMLGTTKVDDWDWIDALQMAMPVFAQLGTLYNDNRYYDRIFEMYMYTKSVAGGNGLYSQVDHLWWRDKDFVPPYKEPNAQNCYWSRGNGWVLAALARVLEVMPIDAPHRDEYEVTFREMAKAVVAVQRSDGFWNPSLQDPNNFGGKELSGTALFTYGIAWGINHGVLGKIDYQPAVEKAWKAMVREALHGNGILGYVQGTGKKPSDGQPLEYDFIPDFEDFGLGCFLLAGSEVYQLTR